DRGAPSVERATRLRPPDRPPPGAGLTEGDLRMIGRLNSAQPYVMGMFRMVVGLLFACHGAVSLLGVLGGTDGNGGTEELGAWPSWYAAMIQLVGGTLVLFGLGTRAAAFISSGSMACAYF